VINLKRILRILKYIENQGISVTDFERHAGFSNGYLINTKKRDADLSPKALIKLKNNQREHYYKIFPEERDNDERPQMNVEEGAGVYRMNTKMTENDLATLLTKAMEMLSQNQRIIEKHTEVIQEHTVIIHDQQATIHELVVNKKTKASA
jgi:hypothetical protein